MSNWHACELHCHTRHSDGEFSTEQLVKTAKERLLDGICITDHNTISAFKDCENIAFPTILNGVELTTYYGHILVLGTKDYIDWAGATPDNVDSILKKAQNKNGIVGIAHPFQLGTPICTGGHWDYKVKDFSLINYIEIWSEGNPFMNTANKRAYDMWLSLLDKGYKLSATFGRDWHNAENDIFPTACTYLKSSSNSFTKQDMLLAIKNGQTVLSIGPLFVFQIKNGKAEFMTDFTRFNKINKEMKIEPKKIRLLTNGKKEILSVAYKEKVTTETDFQKGNYYIAELYGTVNGKENCLISLTSPVYFGY